MDLTSNHYSPAAQAIVLFGSPGSGKGTQAELLKGTLRVPHISTGDMLRERIRKGCQAAAEVAATMHAGALVPDDVVNRLVEERLSEPDAQNGFILDGYPRTRSQAEHLLARMRQAGMEEVVIHLVVEYNTIIARLTGRRQCPRCGTLYNIISKPPREAGVCDLDGTRLIIRDDDREAVIRERLDAYERQTRPLIEFFRDHGRLYEIDASRVSPEEVFRQICHSIRASAANGSPVDDHPENRR